MALSTTGVSLEPGVWQEIGSNVLVLMAQVQSVSPAAIYAGADNPDSASSYLILSVGGTDSIVLDNLAGAAIWAKGLDSPASLVVVKG